MTRSHLIIQLSAAHPHLTTKDVDLIVRTVLDTLSNTLAQGERIEIRGFGSFGLTHRPSRNGRNPKTGEAVLVPAKSAVHFKAGKELRGRVDTSK